MTTFYVVKDYETPKHAGADGLFQVSTLRRLLDDKEVTNQIDVEKFFSDDDELKNYISEVFKIKIEDLEIVE